MAAANQQGGADNISRKSETGVTIKAYLVDLEKETLSDPVVVRSHQSDTVADLTQDVADAFNVSHEKMRLCVEQYYRDVKLLEPPSKPLKQEGFYKAVKVFAEEKGEDDVLFTESKLFKFLDSAAYEISLCITLPSSELQQNDKPKTITLQVDRRITLADVKQELEVYVGQPSNQFRIFRVYSNSQEFEVTRLDNTLITYSDDTKLVVKFGRSLAKGEYRVKVFELKVNNPEPSQYLFDWIVAKKTTIRQCKEQMQSELGKHGVKAPLDRLRIRKKTWRNPGTILLDNQAFDEDFSIYANWEMFIEVLSEPEPLKTMSDISLFARRWHPSTYTLEPFHEVVLKQSSPTELKEKISEVSGIPVERVEFAKGRGSFPCEVSILEIQEELDWNPQVTVLSVWPLYICDDGAVIYYRDSEEKLMVLSEARRREIQKQESARYAKSNTKYH